MTQSIQYSLEFLADGLTPKRIPLGHFPFTLGRLEDRDYVVVDKSVSRDHAAVLEEEDGIYIVDKGSRFGTFVNGVPRARTPMDPPDTQKKEVHHDHRNPGCPLPQVP